MLTLYMYALPVTVVETNRQCEYVIFLERRKEGPMANHLNLRHTLLEFDLLGNLTIFSEGRSAHLLAAEVLQWLDWLVMEKEQRPPTLHLGQHTFEFAGAFLVVDGAIRIEPLETRQLDQWIRRWWEEKSHPLA